MGEADARLQARPAAPAAPKAPPPGNRRWGGVKPYVGGGFGWVGYKESSDFSTSGEDADDRFSSVHVLGGVEIPVWKWLGAAAEFNYRWVGGALRGRGRLQGVRRRRPRRTALRVKLTVGR